MSNSQDFGRPWTQDDRLLLIYKDSLDDRADGSPFLYQSPTIVEHLAWAHSNNPPPNIVSTIDPRIRPKPVLEDRYKTQIPLPGFTSSPSICVRHKRIESLITGTYAVWGWWRKPWETHHRLLRLIKDACAAQACDHPQAILYNSYLGRAYTAKIMDVYFEQALTTVAVPNNWYMQCPSYYRDNTKLCGAFFLLDISKQEIQHQEVLDKYIDSWSFELEDNGFVIPIPRNIPLACEKAIGQSPARPLLRTTEHTIFVVRVNSQKARTQQVIRDAAANLTQDHSKVLLDAFNQTSWEDISEILCDDDSSPWKVIHTFTQLTEILVKKSNQSDDLSKHHLTRFDFELVSESLGTPMFEGLFNTDRGKNLASCLKSWVTAPNDFKMRGYAAEVFCTAWKCAEERYELDPIGERFFKSLPAMEVIGSSVKHEIGGKFYRDHLSHNVRAALLTATLVQRGCSDLKLSLDGKLVAFFSGLFHDLTMTLTSYPETIRGMATPLREINLTSEFIEHLSFWDSLMAGHSKSGTVNPEIT